MKENITSDKLQLSFLKYFIYILFCTFSFLIICGFGNTGFGDIILILISVFVSSAAFAAYSFKIPRRIVSFAVLAFSSGLLAFDIFGKLPDGLRITDAFNDIFISYSPGNRASAALLLVIILLVTLFTYTFTVKRLRPAVLAAAEGIIFILQLLSGGKNAVYFIFLFAALIFTLFIRSYVDFAASSFLTDTGLGRIAFSALLTAAASVAAAAFLPYPSAPLSDNPLSRAVRGKLPYYSVGQEGEYEGESELGGRLKFKDGEVMSVDTRYRIKLAGSIKTDYTGYSWRFGRRESHPYGSGAPQDFAEILHSFSLADKYRLLSFNTAKITLSQSSGNTLFVPPLTAEVSGESLGRLYIADDGTFFSAQTADKTVYSAESCIIDPADKETARHLMSAYKGAYDNAADSDSGGITGKELLKKRDGVYDSCLNLPDSLPRRVRNLAKDLTAGSKSDFEKAEAIRNYLLNFKYTTKPPDTDKNKDFTDQFLFEQKEGYCTYYATAMAVLCRCAGIPARYAEGYVLPAEYEKTEGGYRYSVSGREAHSWVQVYLEGVGWIDFEPTPPYYYIESGRSIPRDIFKNVSDAEQFESALEGNNGSGNSSESEKDHQRPQEGQSEPSDQNSFSTESQALKPDKTENQPEGERSKIPAVLMIIFLPPLFILLILAAFSRLCRRKSEKRMSALMKLNRSRAAAIIFKETEEIYRLAGIRRNNDETAGDFLRTASAAAAAECSCAEITERALYSDQEISEEELSRVIRCFENQKNTVKKMLSKPRRFIYSRLLHKI